MVRSFCGFPLLIVILLGSSGQLSSATAGVIPLESWKRFHQSGSSLKCSNGSYRAMEYLNGRESPICRVCSKCGCGVIIQRQCSSSADTVCTEQCQDTNSVFNQTLRACVSLLGGENCSLHACAIKRQSADYQYNTTTMSTYFTNLIPESGSELSPLHAFGIASGVLVILTIGTTAIVLIARRRGYLKGTFRNPSFCKALNTASPKIKRALMPKSYKKKYEMLLQRLSCTVSEEIPTMGRRDLHMSSEDLTETTTAEPRVIMSTDLPLAEDIEVSHDGEDPYWLVMRGWFTAQGGVLRCKDSDVYLQIPPGAIPQSIERQEIVAKVALVTSRFDYKLKKDEVCLSPVIELLSPGLDAFDDLVTIYVPHRARLDPDWSFRVHYTHSHGNTEGGWQAVDQEGSNHPDDCNCVVCHRSPSDVTFRTNKTHFVIKTPHFSKYVCSGCGKKRYLNLEALVSAKYLNLPNRQQVDLNCYIVDTIKDYWHRVKDNEGQRPRSERHPIHLKSKEPLTVSLLTDDNTLGKECAWRPETYGERRPTCVAIPIRNIVRCCSDAVPYFVTFSLRPKTSGNHDLSADLFESVVSYKQKESSLELPISIAFDLRDQNNAVQQLSSLPSTPRLATDVLIKKVAEEISGRKWKDLFRRLLYGDNHVEPQIEELEEKYRDIREVKYQMLRTWRQMKGKDATCQKLSQALRACGLVNIAEGIEDETTEYGSDNISLHSSTV